MITLDRLNALRVRCGMSHRDDPITMTRFFGHAHEELDHVDRYVGIVTRHKCAKVYTGCALTLPHSEYVGARLRRLERHVEANTPLNYFHLGAGAEA